MEQQNEIQDCVCAEYALCICLASHAPPLLVAYISLSWKVHIGALLTLPSWTLL